MRLGWRAAAPVVFIMCAACSASSSGDDSVPTGGHLTVTSASGSQAECEGSFSPGESVKISDPRFAPGIEVSLEITPPSGASRTSIVAADQSGTVSTTIQLPQVVGSVYISVSGTGPTGEQVNDTTGVDLLASGSPL